MHDLRYYTKWKCTELFDAYDGTKGYVILHPWDGGINNFRMSVELAVCIAYLSNKILVLPPKGRIAPLPDPYGVEDVFEVSDMGIRTMAFHAFCTEQNIPCTYEGIRSISASGPAYGPLVLNFTTTSPPTTFTKNREVFPMQSWCDEHVNVFFDATLLGNFAQRIYSPDENRRIKQLIARHVHYREEFFDTARQFIRFLGDREYYAMHVRRDDFAYRQWWISAEAMLENVRAEIPDGSILYIATDHTDKTFFHPFMDRYKVIFYEDIPVSPIVPNHIPIIEQLICSRACKFIGTEWSTLSTYVNRIRGYMADITDTNYHVNTKVFSPDYQPRFHEVPSDEYDADWKREYRDAWEF